MRLGRRGELPRGSIETPAVRILFFFKTRSTFLLVFEGWGLWSLKAVVFGL